MTARLLTEEPIEVVPDLREHERHSSDWVEDFEAVVRRAFAEPDVAAYDGWEPLGRCRDRVVSRRPPASSPPTAEPTWCWSATAPRGRCCVAALRGEPPDLDGVGEAGDAGRLSMRGPASTRVTCCAP